MLAAAFLFCDSHLVLAAVTALLWHEAAHVIVMALCGVKRCHVELTPFGGMADAACFERLAPWKQAAISMAGVLASATGVWIVLRFLPATPFCHALLQVHGSLAFLNCLPVWPLDGARALLALAAHFGHQRALQKLLQGLAYLLGAVMVCIGLYGAWLGHINLSLLLLGPYLCHAAHESALSQTVRRVRGACQSGEKLRGDRLVPLRAYACEQLPKGRALLRLISDLPPQCTHVLVEVDTKSGAIKQVHTEQTLAAALFETKTVSQGLPAER